MTRSPLAVKLVDDSFLDENGKVKDDLKFNINNPTFKIQNSKFLGNPDDKFETLLFLQEGEGRKGEGGLRTKGYFKFSYKKMDNKWFICDFYGNILKEAPEDIQKKIKEFINSLDEGHNVNELPLITVITVVYNGAKTLEQTIQSVINQTYPNVEYIIIDGGSTDGTLNIIKNYEDYIDYWVSEKDKGIYDAMNKGIDAANGEWINFMNAGDGFCGANIIENLVNDHIFQNNKGIVTGYVRIVDVNGRWQGYKHPYKKLKDCDFRKENCIAHQATFTHKEVFKKIGKFSLEYKIQGDYDFWLRAKKNKISFKHIDKDIANFLNEGLSSDRSHYEISLREKYTSLLKNKLLTSIQCKLMLTKELSIYKLKKLVRGTLGGTLSNNISKYRLRKTLNNQKLIFDMSIKGATRAGVYVFANNINKELSTQEIIPVVTFNNPFSSVGKTGFIRKLNSLLRLLYMELIYFKGGKGDIFFFPGPEVAMCFLVSKKKYIVVIHDIYSWKNQKETTLFARVKNKLLPFIAKKAHLIGTVSEFSKNELVTNFNIQPEKIFVIPNGLDIGFKTNDAKRPIVDLVNTEYILNVGSLEPRKNIAFLIDVFENIKNSHSRNLKLVLTGGESWSSTDIFSKISNSKYKNEIVILGNVPNESLPWLYRNAKVMVFPSKEEGFGIPVIESLSQGTPVIVHKNSALEAFDEYGATVVDNYDISQWSDLVIDILEKNHRISDFFKNKVIKTFCWNKSAQKIVDKLYK